MKIEVGESLMRSWLRHVKGCQFAELNWKPSSDWVEYDNSQRFMDRARAFFQEKLGSDIFEGTKTASQSVKQGEMDVLGIKLDGRGVTERLYGVDIAFHEGGLNYRDTKGTTVRVVKKIVRSIMISQTYFGQVHSEFVFASPKVGKAFLDPLESGIALIKELLIDEEMDCQVTLLANEKFRTEVLLPTLERSSGTADSSELFLRSYRLWRLFDSRKPSSQALTAHESGVVQIQSALNNSSNGTLPIHFDPANKNEFMNRLLNCRKARIIVDYANGTSKENPWIIEKLTRNSNLLDNLRSRPEFRQGEWQKRGIARVRVVVDDNASPNGG